VFVNNTLNVKVLNDLTIPALGFTFRVLTESFIFHIGFKENSKMHANKNIENKVLLTQAQLLQMMDYKL